MKDGDPSKHFHYLLLEFCSDLQQFAASETYSSAAVVALQQFALQVVASENYSLVAVAVAVVALLQQQQQKSASESLVAVAVAVDADT